jgi:hypothetical protein
MRNKLELLRLVARCFRFRRRASAMIHHLTPRFNNGELLNNNVVICGIQEQFEDSLVRQVSIAPMVSGNRVIA